jgi:hypothetical protein
MRKRFSAVARKRTVQNEVDVDISRTDLVESGEIEGRPLHQANLTCRNAVATHGRIEVGINTKFVRVDLSRTRQIEIAVMC